MATITTKTRAGALSMTPSAALQRRNGAAIRSAATAVNRRSSSKTPSATAIPRRAGRTLTAGVRADVNWDAFRPPQASSSSPFGGSDRGSSSLYLPGAAFASSASTSGSGATASSGVQQVDFLVLGSGIAGLTYALKVAEYGTVAVVTKDYAHEGCTQYAQGGVCAVLDKHDSVAKHVSDTMIAGAFLNDPQAVEVVCREGPARVLELMRLGAEFSTNADGSLHLTKEGGHSARRVVHAADMTGREIERALLAAARSHRNIRFYEHHLATDLVVDEYAGVRHCFGADVLDQRAMSMTRFVALSTMMACGGAGQVFPNTTNPHVATGDGIAMGYRAGAAVSNMEFIQFHPTALYTDHLTNGAGGGAGAGGSVFLITEAVRGEGGILLNQAGERFMGKYDAARMELAPRDVVARSIHNEMMERGERHVLLDISHKPCDEVTHHFPNIHAKCLELGLDMTRGPIPVVPAQHYTCGGVQTGLLAETAVQGLYAAGEVACSGLHGANRLASNSLLEGLVFADRAVNPSVAHAEHALRSCGRQLHYAAASACFTGARGARAAAPALAAWAAGRRRELREAMWAGCGIVRRAAGVAGAGELAAEVAAEAEAALRAYGVNTELVELRNLATVAGLVTACAAQRKESRGGHYCLDHPREVEQERRPSMVSLLPLTSTSSSSVPVPVGISTSTASSSSSSGSSSSSRGGRRGGAAGAGKKAGLGSSAKEPRVQQRDMVTRSMPPDEAR